MIERVRPIKCVHKRVLHQIVNSSRPKQVSMPIAANTSQELVVADVENTPSIPRSCRVWFMVRHPSNQFKIRNVLIRRSHSKEPRLPTWTTLNRDGDSPSRFAVYHSEGSEPILPDRVNGWK